MNVSVVIPSYKRAEHLLRCIKALFNQKVPPYEIIVVLREDDTQSIRACEGIEGIKVFKVSEPGVLIAMNKGLDVAEGDIIAFTDDDAEPFPDWIEKIIKNFQEDERVGGVGGRDIIIVDGKEIKGRVKRIGKIQWFGRAIDHHHLELEGGRKIEVDVLKGVNMAFRRDFIKNYRFDLNMNNISSVSFEFDICFYIKKKGGKIVYDPELKVKHYPAPRKSGSQREDEINMYEYSRNYTYVMSKHLPFLKKSIFLLYFFLIGQRASYGPILYIFDLLTGKKPSLRHLKKAMEGKIRGLLKILK
jgi:glycosyltransferase involved in cell wall biosynthesis